MQRYSEDLIIRSELGLAATFRLEFKINIPYEKTYAI
jgi:hypothetical protein